MPPESILELVDVASKNRGTIASLTKELLRPILVELVHSYSLSPKQGAITWRRRVELTTVCKEWRRIALAYPAFWSGFYLRPRLWGLAQMLPRWQNHPRKIAVTLSDLSASDAAWSEFENLYTTELVRELHVTGSDSHGPGTMERVWKILVPLAHTAFDNLEILYLKDLFRGASSRILDVLLSSQHLQEIHIEDSIPRDYAPAFTWAHPPLRSCHLTKSIIHISSANPVLQVLMRILTPPIPQNLNLTFYPGLYLPSISTGLPPTEQLLTEVVQRIGSHLDATGGSWNLELERERSQPYMRVTAFQPDEDGSGRLSLTLPDIPWGLNLLGHLDAPPSTKLSVTMNRMSSLYTTDETSALHPETTWRSFFSRHPNIETLVLQGAAHSQATHILAALAPSLDGSGDSEDASGDSEDGDSADGDSETNPLTLLLPKLQKLTLYCRTGSANTNDATPDIDFQYLCILAVCRFRFNKPISVLEFHRSEGLESEIIRLRERVSGFNTEVVDRGST